MTIREAAAAIRERRVSSAELTAECLQRIARHDQELKAFITVTEEVARQQARDADEELARGKDHGPLHGIPMALKDLFYTRGIRTTSGSRILADFVPDRDGRVVERLRAAGAVLVGKTNLHELAYGITSTNPHFGTVRNPWDTARIPGGSSGGSGAAVATGMALMAMGSDTGGSIRIPASFCGTVGFKATFERVSREGGHPLGFTLDHMGPLTRTVRDAAVVLDAITEDREASTVPQPGILLDGIRLGVPRNFYLDRIAPAVRRAYDNCVSQAERFGASISEITVPDIEALNAVARVILLAEAASVMHRFRDRRGDIGADVRALHDQGRMISAVDYIDAQRLRRVITRDFGRSVAGVDCFLTPTTPTTAPLIGQATVDFGEGASEDVRLATTRLVRGINVLGWPALSIPCGFDEGHLPIGLQIVGRPFRDDVVLRTGAALEDALGPAPLAV